MVFTEFKNKLANSIFLGSTTVALPTAYYLALSTTEPTLDGANITEPPTGSGYTRIKMDKTLLTEPVDGVVSNVETIDYGEATSDWGEIIYAVFMDGEGTPCFASPMHSAVEVNAGDVFRIKAGNAAFGFGGV